MEEIQNTSNGQKQVWQATIIRADGSTQSLGIIVGGSKKGKIISYLLIKYSNLRGRIKKIINKIK